ncbi:Flp family type IVb pilin [Hoeflea ulvae]|uniref:Flp family type IVb pilin n=1 Tax=Hoeflea ulvae TaxID=2983764 RepID=A0ABT3Y974_9HYPH|nr:Flp family type IVb pilin [Hoeflea ulvae]MCY0092454.1 Flp family type IVb pilin [Hoeflea ulvae]
MKNLLYRFLEDRSGATAIEYGLITSLIAIALVAGGISLGNAITGTMDNAALHLENSR